MKILISSEFINSTKLKSKLKWVLLTLLEQTLDNKLTVDQYRSIVTKYNLDADDTVKLSSYVKLQDGTVTFDKKGLKKFGISIFVRKYKAVEIPEEKLFKLMEAYNKVRNEFHLKKYKKRPTAYINKPNMNAHYKHCIDFFEEKRIDNWYEYLYTLQVAVGWSFLWSLNSVYSKKAEEAYNKFKHQVHVQLTTKDAQSQTETSVVLNKWVHTFNHVEAKKEAYLRNHTEIVCYNNMDVMLGFHPHSEFCKTCQLQAMCAKTLHNKFKEVSKSTLDIVKVRRKEMTLEQARFELKLQGSTFEL